MLRSAALIALPMFVCAGLSEAIAEPHAEEAPSQEILFSNSIDHGGYGGPNFGVTHIGKELVPMLGGGGGWLIDHHLLIGGMGWAIGGGDAPPSVNAEHVEMALGGIWIEYLILPHKLVHGSVGGVFGWGGASLHNAAGDQLVDETVFFASPHVSAEVNLAVFMRLAIQVGYHDVRGVDMPGLRSRDLSAMSLSAMAKFGSF